MYESIILIIRPIKQDYQVGNNCLAQSRSRQKLPIIQGTGAMLPSLQNATTLANTRFLKLAHFSQRMFREINRDFPQKCKSRKNRVRVESKNV